MMRIFYSPMIARVLAAAILCGFASVYPVQPAKAQLFGGGSKKAVAQLQRRVNRLEKNLRTLNGQIEQLTHHVRKLRQQMRRMEEDYEARLRSLETGRTVGLRTDEPLGGARKTAKAKPSSDDVPATFRSTTSDDEGVDESEETARMRDAIGKPLDLSAVASGRGTDTAKEGDILKPAVRTVPASPRAAYNQAYDHFLTGEYRISERSFRVFIKDHPDHKLASNALFWVGESLYARGKFRKAANEFLKYYSDYPKTRKAPDSLLKLGMALVKLQETEVACTAFAELGSNYPNAPRTILRRAKAERKRAKC